MMLTSVFHSSKIHLLNNDPRVYYYYERVLRVTLTRAVPFAATNKLSNILRAFAKLCCYFNLVFI